MRLIHRVLSTGRIKHSFALALVMAMLTLPVTEALAYFAATGTGTVTGITAGTASSVVTIARNAGNPITYAGPSTTNLMPGGTVSFSLVFSCSAGCPAQVSTVSLQGWSSDKVGCDSTTLPNSFTMAAHNSNISVPAGTTPTADSGLVTITWANLAVDQSSCSGANFTFTLKTP